MYQLQSSTVCGGSVRAFGISEAFEMVCVALSHCPGSLVTIWDEEDSAFGVRAFRIPTTTEKKHEDGSTNYLYRLHPADPDADVVWGSVRADDIMIALREARTHITIDPGALVLIWAEGASANEVCVSRVLGDPETARRKQTALNLDKLGSRLRNVVSELERMSAEQEEDHRDGYHRRQAAWEIENEQPGYRVLATNEEGHQLVSILDCAYRIGPGSGLYVKSHRAREIMLDWGVSPETVAKTTGHLV